MVTQMLDWMLVPAGLLVLGAYHGWLLHRIIKRPTTTIIGLNSINRLLWVHAMMEDISKNGLLAVQTLRNNMMASTVLASTAITMSSVIAIVMTHARSTLQDVLEDENRLTSSIKFLTLLSCFLLAFLLNVQSIRYYTHAGVLINVPITKSYSPYLTANYVAGIVNKGSHFWSLGLRAFYFSFPLFLWIFGPIPMFLSSVVLVFFLYFLDTSFEFRACEGDDEDDQEQLECGRSGSVNAWN
ncbi:hypothetical protein V2J09_011490 [Rumex salicifolius]